MAFSLYDWIKGGFKVEDTSAEGIKKLANDILASPNLGQTGSTKTWAKQALMKVDDGKLEDAAKFLTGRSNSSSGYFQGRKPNEVKQALAEHESEVGKKLANYASNLANELDFSDPNLTQEQKDRLTERANGPDGTVAKMASIASSSGLPDSVLSKYKAIEKTASGDYVPKADKRSSSVDYRPNAHTGESLGIDVQPDGTYKVIGRTSGKDYGSFPDQSQANAYATQIQSGGTPDATGAFAPATSATEITPTATSTATDTSASTSSILDKAGINYTGLSADEIKNVESAYLAAQNSPDLLQKLIDGLEITDEDITGFLETAKTEYSPYYSQQFARGAEDFTRALEFETAQREDALKQEALNKQLALESEQVSAASAGLATSGIRQKAEARLAEQAQDVATSSRRAFEYGVTSAGRQAEDVLGSSTIAGLTLPTLAGASVYTPAGDIKGSLEREQTTTEQTRAAEFEKLARERRTEILAGEGGVTTL